MKLIIAGGRDIKVSPAQIQSLLDYYKLEPYEIVSGRSQGVDYSGEIYARLYLLGIKTFEAKWDVHGKAAGPIRNQEMAEYGDALLLIWNGTSKGSASMKKEMEKLGKPVYETIVGPDINHRSDVLNGVPK